MRIQAGWNFRKGQVFGTHSLGADSEEKHEPASDVDTELVDSLKALDPERPIREADIHKFAI
jgi:hypothetical protein